MKTILGLVAVILINAAIIYVMLAVLALGWGTAILIGVVILGLVYAYVNFRDAEQFNTFNSAFRQRYMPEPGPAEAAWRRDVEEAEKRAATPRLEEKRD